MGAIQTYFRAPALIFALACGSIAADQSGIRVALQPETNRKPAPKLVLQDSSGKTMDLAEYRGKTVLLDFWTTWCTGCKKEIPWFSEFQNTYDVKGFAVVGVSMDGDGWKVLKPFLAEHHVPYRMVLGNDLIARQYGIQNLPYTFLIGRKGRIAAIYKEGLVDKDNVETNIKVLLSER